MKVVTLWTNLLRINTIFKSISHRLPGEYANYFDPRDPASSFDLELPIMPVTFDLNRKYTPKKSHLTTNVGFEKSYISTPRDCFIKENILV